MHDALVLTRQLSKGLEGTIVLWTAFVSFHLQYTPSPHIMISWKNNTLIKKLKPKIEVYYDNQLERPKPEWVHKLGDWPISKSRVKALNIPATQKQLEIDQASPLTPYTRYPWCRYRRRPFWMKMILMPLRFCSNFDPWVVDRSLRDFSIFCDLIRFTFSPLSLRYAQVKHLSSVYLFNWTFSI